MQPISTVNNTGFQNMIRVFESQYIPPDRKILGTRLLAKNVWNRKETNSGVGWIYSQLCNNNGHVDIQSKACIYWGHHSLHHGRGLQLAVPPSAQQRVSWLTHSREHFWGAAGHSRWLSLRMNLLLLQQQGSNIVFATKILGWPRMPCFSYTLHLAVEQAMSLPNVSRALIRCERWFPISTIL